MTEQKHEQDSRVEIKQPHYATLVGPHKEPCVSIYTAPILAPHIEKLELGRLRALFQTAQVSSLDNRLTVDEVEEILKSHWHLLREAEQIHPRTQSLAIFVSKDFFCCYHLLSPTPEKAVFGHEFYIRPLLTALPTNELFFVLTLSQKHVRLFQGSYHSLIERNVEAVPESLHEDLSERSFEQGYESHTAASPISGTKGAVFHGAHVDRKEQLLHFFRSINHAIANSLKGQQAPLIVAAVDYLFPIYKAANTYPHLLDHAIAGNPDLLSPEAIHAAAWRLIEENASKARDRALAVYGAHIGTPLCSSNLREVLLAASCGVVRFLFVPPAGERWGSIVLPDTVHVHAKREPGDDELLNLAAILTIRHGGVAHVIPSGQFREGSDVAAVFRFARDFRVTSAA
jgi:hypothetical protein